MGRLSFQGSPAQNLPERVRLEARAAYERAQLPAPVQARALEVPAGQLECPLLASRLLNVHAARTLHSKTVGLCMPCARSQAVLDHLGVRHVHLPSLRLQVIVSKSSGTGNGLHDIS